METEISGLLKIISCLKDCGEKNNVCSQQDENRHKSFLTVKIATALLRMKTVMYDSANVAAQDFLFQRATRKAIGAATSRSSILYRFYSSFALFCQTFYLYQNQLFWFVTSLNNQSSLFRQNLENPIFTAACCSCYSVERFRKQQNAETQASQFYYYYRWCHRAGVEPGGFRFGLLPAPALPGKRAITSHGGESPYIRGCALLPHHLLRQS